MLVCHIGRKPTGKLATVWSEVERPSTNSNNFNYPASRVTCWDQMYLRQVRWFASSPKWNIVTQAGLEGRQQCSKNLSAAAGSRCVLNFGSFCCQPKRTVVKLIKNKSPEKNAFCFGAAVFWLKFGQLNGANWKDLIFQPFEVSSAKQFPLAHQ